MRMWYLPRYVCAVWNVFMYSSRDFERWSTSSFRKLHMFVSMLFNTTVSLIILESAAVWHNLNSHSCGHLSALLFSLILLRFYFWLLDLFHLISYWVQMSACEHSYQPATDQFLIVDVWNLLFVKWSGLCAIVWVFVSHYSRRNFLNICAVPC